MSIVMTRGAWAEPGSSLAFKTGAWRTQRPVHHHAAAPCHAACPAGEDPQAWLAALDEGRSREAWERLVAVNPLPAITGRICPHPCESLCNRGQYDEAIAIHAVERFLGDEALRQNWAYPATKPAADAPAVAVVGAGPAGLAAAYHLLRGGARVSLFEALPEPGGILRTALPAYRLPRDVLDGEIWRVLSMGIDFQPHRALGKDVSLDELKAQYAAVFVAPGKQQGRAWSVDGVTPGDLTQGLDLLRLWTDVGSVPAGRSVAVVGAGNTAVDVARVLLRCGAGEVHLVSHKAIPGPGVPDDDAMPAIPREIQEALEEGVIIHTHRGIRRLILRSGRMMGVEMVHMKKLPREDGRLERIAFHGTETVLNVQQVVPAVGQDVAAPGFEKLMGGKSYIPTGPDGRAELDGAVYVGGDATGGAGTVTAAVGDGRRAAEAILARIAGRAQAPREPVESLAYEALNLDYFERAPRLVEPVLPVAERRGDEEVTGAVGATAIAAEARRCLSCGNCMACDNCWTLCPDQAVLKTREVASDGSHYVFDYDYCKGCGLCASECPCGYIAMEKEP